MDNRYRVVAILTLVVALLAASSAAWAQSTGSISGRVTDTSGAVLPGLTVRAQNDAGTEDRTVVTDGEGRYRIEALRTGTYTVTFTLAGFTTVERQNIVLTTGFNATVNAELAVGAIQETVTVTGTNPQVDVQNVRTQNVLSREEAGYASLGEDGPGLCCAHPWSEYGREPGCRW